MEKDVKLSIVIPTYNEVDNISILVERIFNEFDGNGIFGEVVIVDDNSSDGTGEKADELSKKYNLKVVHRSGKLGLSSAVLDGFNVSMGNVLGVMDADLSHPSEKIPEMFGFINRNEADFVIGSRYITGGKIIGWNLKRKLMSRGATILARPFTKVKDPMTGFFMIKRDCLKDREFDSKGFKILLELLIKANYKRVKEVPITFINRTKGKSKAGTNEIIFYLKNLWGYFKYKKIHKEFIKFAVVGGIGTIINLAILYSLTEYGGLYYLISAIFSFIIAATSNYILNKIWTFKENFHLNLFNKYFKFIVVSIVALVVNLIFLYIFTEYLGTYYMISQVFSIGIALIINFLGNKIWTFQK